MRWILTAGGIIAIHCGHGTGAVSTAQAPAGRGARRGRSGAARDCSSETEERLAEVAGEPRRVLGGHAGGTLAAGGKRLRPMLVFLCGGAATEQLVAAAAASSCCTWRRSSTTTCSTGAALRRGRPTVFAAGGPRAATATGDLLFSRAFAELAAPAAREAVRRSRRPPRRWRAAS